VKIVKVAQVEPKKTTIEFAKIFVSSFNHHLVVNCFSKIHISSNNLCYRIRATQIR